MVPDPVFGLFQIPTDRETESLYARHLVRRGAHLAFSAATAERGLYPICYRPAVTRYEKPHTHGFLELFLAMSGRSDQRVGDGVYPVERGDLFFVNPAVPHHFVSPSTDFQVLVVSFLPRALGLRDEILMGRRNLSAFHLLKPFADSSATSPHLCRSHPETDFRKILFHGLHLVESYFAPPPAPSSQLHAQLKVLLHLSRGDGDKTQTTLGEVTDWVAEHWREDLTVDRVARHFGVSPNWFSTRWNRAMGVRFLDHVATLRVNGAKELLSTTDWPMARIAEATGFATPAHFSTVFRKHLGVNPREWRGGRQNPGTRNEGDR